MAIQDSTFPLQDALICDELRWADSNVNQASANDDDDGLRSVKEELEVVVVVGEEDLWWDEEELKMLLNKEAKQQGGLSVEFGLRAEAVEWMMRVVAHYGFTAATAVLAVDYMDRLLSTHHCHLDKPWTVQLAAVACLSLAAKVEETRALQLLDFQVEGANFMFKAKTIQRMELLVLSALRWRMHPVTPISFIDHIIRRLGLKPQLQAHFLNQAGRILMSLISDSRWGLYPPSALASATMLRVMDQLGSYSISMDCQNLLFSALNSFNKEKVSECYKLIHDPLCLNAQNKRKHSPSSSASEQIPALKRTRHDSRPDLLPHHI